MTRKAKAVWIGFLAPLIMGWVVHLFVLTVMGGGRSFEHLPFAIVSATGPSILLGVLVALIAYFCTSGPPMCLRGKAAWIAVVASLIIGWMVLTRWLWGSFSLGAPLERGVGRFLTNTGILVVVLPWCYWPRHGIRKRAILKAYRVGFAIPGTPCVAVFVWMVLRVRFVDLGGGEMAGLGELILAMYALIGIGIAVVIGWIAGIICANRLKHVSDKCERCGYSLVGLTSDKCPECGHTVSSTAPS